MQRSACCATTHEARCPALSTVPEGVGSHGAPWAALNAQPAQHPRAASPLPPTPASPLSLPQDVDSGHHGSGFPLPLWRRRLLEQFLTRQVAAAGGTGTVDLPGYANGGLREISLGGLVGLVIWFRLGVSRTVLDCPPMHTPCCLWCRGGAAVGGARVEHQQHAARTRQRAQVGGPLCCGCLLIALHLCHKRKLRACVVCGRWPAVLLKQTGYPMQSRDLSAAPCLTS